MVEVSVQLTDDEWKLISMLASSEGKSPNEVLTELVQEFLGKKRVEIAIQQLREEKVSFRSAWKLSGLPLPKFIEEVTKAGISVS